MWQWQHNATPSVITEPQREFWEYRSGGSWWARWAAKLLGGQGTTGPGKMTFSKGEEKEGTSDRWSQHRNQGGVVLSHLFGEQRAKSGRGSVGKAVWDRSHAQVPEGLSVPLASLALQWGWPFLAGLVWLQVVQPRKQVPTSTPWWEAGFAPWDRSTADSGTMWELEELEGSS